MAKVDIRFVTAHVLTLLMTTAERIKPLFAKGAATAAWENVNGIRPALSAIRPPRHPR